MPSAWVPCWLNQMLPSPPFTKLEIIKLLPMFARLASALAVRVDADQFSRAGGGEKNVRQIAGRRAGQGIDARRHRGEIVDRQKLAGGSKPFQVLNLPVRSYAVPQVAEAIEFQTLNGRG